MSLKVASRVHETTTTTGTGTLSLAGAVTNFQTFVAGVGNGNRTTYTIVDSATGAWERGIGTVTDGTPDTLSRDLVLESTNGDAAVNFAAGTKDVFVDHDPTMVASSWIDAATKAADWTLDVNDNGTVFEIDITFDITATLPPLADVWVGWSTTFYMRECANVNKLIIDADGSELIDLDSSYRLHYHGEYVTIVKASATKWAAINANRRSNLIVYQPASVSDPIGFNATTLQYTPSPGTRHYKVTLQAPGGAGGAGHTTDNACGSGGSAGMCWERTFTRGQITEPITLVLPTGATCATTSSNGSHASEASFGSFSAAGGDGGPANGGSSTVGGAAGGLTSITAGISHPGANGAPGVSANLIGGDGGDSYCGKGGKGGFPTAAAGTRGGGGGGGKRTASTNRKGADGGDSICYVEEIF